jgi:predicted ATPase
VRLSMGATTKDIAALIPELLEPSQQASEVPSAIEDASPARFRAFDAICQFFQRAAQRAPVTLALEDLHWADAPSLALLEFLSEHLPRGRLLIVGTYRDTHASAKTPLMRTLGGLKRGADVERIHLSRLSLSAIGTMAQQLCSTRLSGPLVKAIHQQTDGNPLFATELIRVLIDEGDGTTLAALPAKIPAGVHETIGRRLLRLSDGCNAILCVAAILGRQFTAAEIAAIMDVDVQRVMVELEPALQTAVVDSNTEVPGGYRFTHALIRETIYEDLPAVERVRLHARAAAALVAIHSTYLQPVLTRIAHHYYESVALGS